MQITRPTLRHVSRDIHATVCALVSEGAGRGDVSLALLAYALSLEHEACGALYVADHLQRLARRFEAGEGLSFAQVAFSETVNDQKLRSAA